VIVSPKSIAQDFGSIDGQALLSGLFEHSALAIYGADGSCTLVNQAFVDLFGSEPRREYNLLRDDLLEQQGLLELVRRAFRGETVRAPKHWHDSHELRPARGDVGRRVGVELTLFPLPNAHGDVAHIALCFTDVTAELELTAASNAVRQSEQRFRATFEQAGVGVAHVAPDGQWLDVNQRLCDIVGYTRSELLERTFQDITYAPDLGIDLEFVRKMLASELSSYSMEKRYVCKDGHLIWIELTVSLVRDRTGAPDYFISMVQDISERKRTQDALLQSTRDLQTEIIERKRIERELRESEERLATTLNSIGDGVIASDAEGRITRMNPIAMNLTGWSLEEASGKQLSEVFRILNEDTRAPIESPAVQVLREGVVVGLANHTLLVARDGTERAIADSGAPIRDVHGSLRGVVLVFRDQTAERNAERALRDSEARKAAILEAALDAIITMDDAGLITEFNPAAERTFGYARAAVIGKPLVELIIPPSLRARHLAGIERHRLTGVGPILGKRLELPALRADGSEFPVELTVVPTLSNGVPTFTAYVRDIAERKQAAEALQVSEARFGYLADSGLIGIIITDTRGNVHDANEAFLKIVGFSRTDLISGAVSWFDMTPPELRHLDDAAIEQLKRTGAATPWEKEYIRKDGSRAPVLVGVAMLDASLGIAFVLDLSERNRAKAAGANAIRVAELESANRKRAEEALRQTEEQLRQSQKMEAVGTLAGSIAHDFNNILSVILSYADLLLRGLQAADPMRADLEQIARAGTRAADLTHQLLAFSRQQVLQPKIINLNDAISTMTQMLQRLIGEDIELAVRLTPNLSAVFVDPSQVEQVLLNLVVNARDAMPRGGKLTIETTEVVLDQPYADDHLDVLPGPYVMLCVSDTGSGMDSATQSRIFEPFFTTKETGRGTGLGLSTVFGIVKQSGGSIWVYSELFRGSTFKVYLPRAQSDASVGQSGQAAAPPVKVRGTETVLLVEDNPEVRALVCAILRRYGYHVLEATTAGDALLICEQYQDRIHLLLTDVVMPRMSGRELWERLAPLRPTTRVIFMSGYTDDAIVRHGVLSSGVSFIQKPLTPEPLVAKVRQVLDRP
jgi:two-component system cell cycle sensor histidine kinase/response regulator CckA